MSASPGSFWLLKAAEAATGSVPRPVRETVTESLLVPTYEQVASLLDGIVTTFSARIWSTSASAITRSLHQSNLLGSGVDAAKAVPVASDVIVAAEPPPSSTPLPQAVIARLNVKVIKAASDRGRISIVP